MTGKDLFIALGNISPKYYDEAENDTIAPSQGHKSLRRPLLIAAVIALTLLLVGCAVVYVLSLNGIKLGNQLVTYDIYDENPNSKDPFAVVGQKTYTQQVLTLAGLSGTPVHQAAREWYEFQEMYDPDKSIMKPPTLSTIRSSAKSL